MNRIVYTILVSLLCWNYSLYAQNSFPEIEILNYQFEDGILNMSYSLADEENDEIKIEFYIADKDGIIIPLDENRIEGDIGFPILPDGEKQIEINLSEITVAGDELRIKILADDLMEVDKQSIVDQVTSESLFNLLTSIDGIRHRTANIENLNHTRDLIESMFDEANLSSRRQDFDFGNFVGQNIIGFQSGTDSALSTLLIDGHYDTVNNSPGADDNGSGTVGMLESMRILSQYDFERSIEYIGFDLEETGLNGSLHYVNQLNNPESIYGVINLEMIGYFTEDPNTQEFPPGIDLLFPDLFQEVMDNDFRGDFITNVAIESSNDLAQAFITANETYVPELKTFSLIVPDNLISLAPDLLRSDHAPFWGAGIMALMITDSSNFRNPHYHSPSDSIPTLDFEFMEQVVKTSVGVALDVGNVRHSDSDVIFIENVISFNNNYNDLPCSFDYSQNDSWLSIDFKKCDLNIEKIEVNNVMGQLMHSVKNIKRSTELNISVDQFLSGIYLLSVYHNGTVNTKKIFIH